MKAKKHLDFLEPKLTDNKSLGSKIRFLLLLCAQYLYEDDEKPRMGKDGVGLLLGYKWLLN